MDDDRPPTLREWKVAYFRDEWRRYRHAEQLFPDDAERRQHIRHCRRKAAEALLYYIKQEEEPCIS